MKSKTYTFLVFYFFLFKLMSEHIISQTKLFVSGLPWKMR